MRSLVYTDTLTVEMRDWEKPSLEGELSVIEVSHCGICGSDMHAYHGHDARRVPPLILGHEVAGVAVNGTFKGKRVVLNPLMTCGTCWACTSGREHLCPDRELIGMRMPGGFAEFVGIRERNLVEIPDHLSFENAALVEPLAVCVHAVDLGLNALHETVIAPEAKVLGGGAIGLLTALVLRARGVVSVRIAESNPVRRSLLERVCDAEVYDPVAHPAPPSSADIVFDCVGSGITRAASSDMIKPGGVIVHVGLQDDRPGLDTRRLTLQEVTFLGTYCYAQADFRNALDLLIAGTITGDGWSEIRPLEEGATSFRDIHEGRAPPKIILSL
ncbi:MAG: alcohol dehydrogenase catalytic domain-containing protein [Pseudomonadota bacterium]